MVRDGPQRKKDGPWREDGEVYPIGIAGRVGALRAQLMDMAAQRRMMNDCACVHVTVRMFTLLCMKDTSIGVVCLWCACVCA